MAWAVEGWMAFQQVERYSIEKKKNMGIRTAAEALGNPGKSTPGTEACLSIKELVGDKNGKNKLASHHTAESHEHQNK